LEKSAELVIEMFCLFRAVESTVFLDGAIQKISGPKKIDAFPKTETAERE